MEGKGGSVNKELEFRSWHCRRQRRSLNKEFDFRSCQEGKSGTINKGLDFKIRHCGRQGRGKFIKSQILDSSFKNKSWILDHGIGRQAEGSLNKVFDFGSWHCGRQGRKCK